MRLGTQRNDLDSSPGPSFDGSFRKPGSAASVRTSSSTSTSKFVPTSKQVYRVLKEYSTKLVDLNIFTEHLEDWVNNNFHLKATEEEHSFSSPFLIDELQTFDYALEGVLFQQLLRMPYPPYASDNLKEDEFLALEDFLHTAAEGLWRAFWHKSKPFPYFVAFPHYPRSKFYTVEKAISKGRINGLSGAALVSRNRGKSLHIRWDDVVQFVLFKQNLARGEDSRLSPSVICEALFYGVHILFSRGLSKYNTATTDYVFVSVIDSKFGGVVKLSGDLGKLEVDLSDPYQSIAEWIMCQADISISHVDHVWNKLGNVNWGDLGTLQMLLAMFYSMVQWNGPPRKSMASLAANRSLRLQQRRMETQVLGSKNLPRNENENSMVSYQNGGNYSGEIVEIDSHDNNHHSKKKSSRLNLIRGDIILLEDHNQGIKSFQIQDLLDDGNGCSYIAVETESHVDLLTLYIGAHPSRLEPSWEDMNLWYQVQRQTKVLNILKDQGVLGKNLPEIISSGRIVHSGPCLKQTPKGRCDHPWCGTPLLVTCPVGEPISTIVAREGPLSARESIRCCRDCLSALKSAKMANILHGDIRPENIIKINDIFVLVSWGRAVLEERDSPPLNLHFSSSHALQNGKLCPSSDVESLVYLVYFVSGGPMQQLDSIEAALKWRQRCWAKRAVQSRLGEVSPILKAFADYVDSICGTPYGVDYDVWLRRLSRAADGMGERGKRVEEGMTVRDVVAESSGTSGGGNSL